MSGTARIIEVPIDQLSAEAIEKVVEEFVTRDGTDYAEAECSLEAKRQTVISQLLDGKVALVFDRETYTCNIVPQQQLGSPPAVR